MPTSSLVSETPVIVQGPYYLVEVPVDSFARDLLIMAAGY